MLKEKIKAQPRCDSKIEPLKKIRFFPSKRERTFIVVFRSERKDRPY